MIFSLCLNVLWTDVTRALQGGCHSPLGRYKCLSIFQCTPLSLRDPTSSSDRSPLCKSIFWYNIDCQLLNTEMGFDHITGKSSRAHSSQPASCSCPSAEPLWPRLPQVRGKQIACEPPNVKEREARGMLLSSLPLLLSPHGLSGLQQSWGLASPHQHQGKARVGRTRGWAGSWPDSGLLPV